MSAHAHGAGATTGATVVSSSTTARTVPTVSAAAAAGLRDVYVVDPDQGTALLSHALMIL